MKKKNEQKIKIAATVFAVLMVTLAFAVLTIGIVGVSASGPTYVSGIISSDTTWTATDSPYIVTGNILVEEGVTLTIESGVVVKFNSLKAIQIDGELIARGTGAKPIVFTSNLEPPFKGDWDSISFTGSSIDASYDEIGNYLSGCIMEYCLVEYAGGRGNPAVKIESSSPFISHCTIQENANSGIGIKRGSARIVGNNITGNSAVSGGIHVVLGDEVSIRGNSICKNSASTGGGIRITNSEVNITGNMICGNSAKYGTGGGINVGGGTVSIEGNSICENSAGRGGGIFLISGKVRIKGNSIYKNAADVGSGIHVSGGDVSITYNDIISNSEGSGICFSARPIALNHNNIYNNSPYDLRNYYVGRILATNNWWGTTDEATIQAHIYDWYDDASLGIVDYIPYLTEPVTPENTPPIASFTYSPENPVVNETIIFKASSSYDPDGYITNYEWDFGDGNITNTKEDIITHSYSAAGDYTVNLTVKDNDEATNSTTKEITVQTLVTVTGTIKGINQEPIRNATVTIRGYSGTTNANGNYSIYVLPGVYTVNVTAEGYRSESKADVNITAVTTVTLNFVGNDGLLKDPCPSTTYVLQVINKWAADEISNTTKLLTQINIWAVS